MQKRLSYTTPEYIKTRNVADVQCNHNFYVLNINFMLSVDNVVALKLRVKEQDAMRSAAPNTYFLLEGYKVESSATKGFLYTFENGERFINEREKYETRIYRNVKKPNITKILFLSRKDNGLLYFMYIHE